MKHAGPGSQSGKPFRIATVETPSDRPTKTNAIFDTLFLAAKAHARSSRRHSGPGRLCRRQIKAKISAGMGEAIIAPPFS